MASLSEMDNAWLPLALLAVILAAGLLVWHYLQRTARARRLTRAIRAISTEHRSDLVIPDGMDGEIHLQHLLLTAQGILVMDLKDVSGSIFAGEKLDEWTAMSGQARYRFPNPLADLRARVAAVRGLVRDVPVGGRIVFVGDAEFVHSKPSQAVTLEELEEAFAQAPDRGAETVSAFHSSWERIQLAAQS